MAYRQPYRGNPELKQYYLINDFSGGLDTVSLDEKMRDNEFREMNNIELALQGSISNRKGFGELEHLNQWLEDKSIIMPEGLVNFFKIIRSENTVLSWANDYVDYSLFQTQMNNNKYNLQIIFNSQVSNNVVFYLLTVKNTNGTSGGATVTLTTLLTVAGTIKPNYNIKTIQYVEKIYFLSYDVYNTSDTTKKGICIFNVDDDTLTVLTPQDTYTPTPYEVESFGFNVLRQNPISDVATQGFGDFSIIGTFLTNTSGQIIDKIPNSGNFNLIAFQIGEQMKHQHVVLTIQDQNETNLSYNLEPITDGGGFFTYPIRNLLLTNATSVTIKFTENENIINGTRLNQVSTIVYTGSYFQFGSMQEFLETKINTTTFKVVAEPFKLTPTSSTSFNLSVTVPTGWNLVDVYRALQTQEPQWYDDPILPVNIRVVETGVGNEFFQATSSGLTRRFFDTAGATNSNFLVKEVFATTGILTQETFIKDASNNYYGYTGGTDFLNDFVTLAQPQEILPFTTSFDIGITEEVESADPIDLDGAYITQVQDRLVVYKGNTIYFSEQFQYDYIPNRNFVILPLNSTDEITHINFFRGVYIIFTKESIWRMSGTIFGEDFLLLKVNDFIGCIAPNSVRALNNNLMFLSRQGLYVLTQSFYQEGLENVKKVDEQINNLVEIDENSYSVMYQEQYWLISDSPNYSTLKYYFNIKKANGERPFVTDTYKVSPDNLEPYNGVLYSIKDGNFYRFDRGYTDFFPRGANSSLKPDYMYDYRFVTKNEDLGYPTHDKKIKSVYFKIRTETVSELGVTVFINEKAVIDPNTYTASINEFGEVVYDKVFDANLIVDPDTSLGSFVLGKDMLGKTEVQIHKFLVSSKAKNISIAIQQSTDGYFNIEDIGFLYKLGKVKETG